MALACGNEHVAVVSGTGALVLWGVAEVVPVKPVKPIPAASAVAFGNQVERFVMVAAGNLHAAATTSEGALVTWGSKEDGRLGHAGAVKFELDEDRAQYRFCVDRSRATRHPVTNHCVWRLGKDRFGGCPVLMVACGGFHTLVTTLNGRLWTFGLGQHGALGHGDRADRAAPAMLDTSLFAGAHVTSLAAGFDHSIAATVEGVWAWGNGVLGRLGLGDEDDRLVPTNVTLHLPAVQVAAGHTHSAAVLVDGSLWSWGDGREGQLGLGEEYICDLPTCVGGRHSADGEKKEEEPQQDEEDVSSEENQEGDRDVMSEGRKKEEEEEEENEEEDGMGFDDSWVIMAACGAKHTVALTTTGVWTWGQVGYNRNVLWPRCIRKSERFHNVVSIAAGGDHSMAVTEDGDLFTWGGVFVLHAIAPATAICATQHTHTHTCVRACTRTHARSLTTSPTITWREADAPQTIRSLCREHSEAQPARQTNCTHGRLAPAPARASSCPFQPAARRSGWTRQSWHPGLTCACAGNGYAPAVGLALELADRQAALGAVEGDCGCLPFGT